MTAELRGLRLLHPDVAGARGVVADEEGGEARRDRAVGLQRLDPRSVVSAKTASATGAPGSRRAVMGGLHPWSIREPGAQADGDRRCAACASAPRWCSTSRQSPIAGPSLPVLG